MRHQGEPLLVRCWVMEIDVEELMSAVVAIEPGVPPLSTLEPVKGDLSGDILAGTQTVG